MMKRGTRDGLTLEGMISVAEDERDRYPVYLRLINLLAVIAGVWAVMSVMIECLNMPVWTMVINMIVLFVCAALYLLFLWKAYDVVKLLILGALYALHIYVNFSRLSNGFYIAENLAIDRINSYYETFILRYMANYYTQWEDLTLLVFTVMFPIAVVFILSVLRGSFVKLCKIIIVIPCTACFAVGIVPSELSLITLILIMIYLVKIQPSKHLSIDRQDRSRRDKINISAAILLSSMCLMLIFLIKTAFSHENYNHLIWIKEAKAELQSFFFDLSLEDYFEQFQRKGWNSIFNRQRESYGGLGNGELGTVDEITYDGTEHLRIKVPEQSARDGIYLKGYVGMDYTGDSWEGPSGSYKDRYEVLTNNILGTNPVNQVSLLLKQLTTFQSSSNPESGGMPPEQYRLYRGTIQIEYVNANRNYIYAPYFAGLEEQGNLRYEQDLYASPEKRENSYQFAYFYGISLKKDFLKFLDINLYQWPKEYLLFEKQYREYVYDAYTRLPEKGLDRLKEDFTLTLGNDASLTEKIQYIKTYLHSTTSYTLSPGKLPKGKDFVEYFLYENKLGYCSHYASAATLMLRVMGVPARYVEGYAVNAADEAQGSQSTSQVISIFTNHGATLEEEENQLDISVRDYNAHAWVEVYVDGCGFIPVEFTPAAAVSNMVSPVEEMLVLQEDIGEDSYSVITPTKMPATPTLPAPTSAADEEEATVTLPVDGSGSMDEGRGSGFTGKNFWIVTMTGFLQAPLILLLYRIHLRNRRMRLFSGDRNKKARYLYWEIERLLEVSRTISGKEESLEEQAARVEEHCQFMQKGALASCIEIVRKASYGKGIIEYRELREVESFHHELCDEIDRKGSVFKKIFYKLALLL